MNRFRPLLSALCLLAPLHAHAQGDANADKDRARELMAQGREARAAGREQDALQSFTDADAIMHVPTTTLEVARSQVALGQLVEAQKTLRLVDVLSPDEREPAAFAKAREAALQLDLELSRRIPVLRVTFTDAEEGYAARVTIDGVEVSAAALLSGYRLNPGSHRLEAHTEAREASRDLVLAEQEIQEVRLQLLTRSTPVQSAPAPAPTREKHGVSAGVYALSGVALAGVATGTTFALLAGKRHRELRSSCAPRCSQSAADEVSQRYTIANVSFAVSAAAAAGAVVWYLLDRDSEPERERAAWSVGVAPTPGGGAFDVQGRF